MKKIYPVLLLSLSMFLCSCENNKTEKEFQNNNQKKEVKKEMKSTSLDSESKKFSYVVGVEIGESLKNFKEQLDIDSFMKGVNETLAGKASEIDPQEAFKLKNDMFKKITEEKGKKNKEEGEKFLAENKTKEGVVVTESGLQYKVLKEGEGEKPAETDRVTVHYEGKLISGKVFDSSVKRGEPATFPVNGVIKGWIEALQLMNVGSKYELYIPSDIAYGSRGAGQDIGPDSVLIFEVELLAIEGKKPEKKEEKKEEAKK